MEWCFYGNDVREKFEKRLEPDALEAELMRYQYVFEDEFSLQDLLTILDLRAKALIAEAINNVPEFLIDQIGKARNSYDFPSLVREMERIANVMEENE
ncbi:HrcA family transcriptional regulator [Blautia sp. HCP28S3_G10]|uniref:HrcA family transcriptional regulator n=1 Tax=Blautia sp. HCP28S3_G10 TaxID=3438908 RepID=UPI003F8CC8CB